ncbi:hypothetical protein F5144DRAFT_567593 [Chaetomium tenue]|uniref:Uncharacterized protein n=1 Tax=Chaetomium tenue TaxID=1854479 RepID=A0ACB7PDS8_9PEZI|nr:hypothetical protein F5144DRAFT_567593 [Chaetomium globosum]
MGLDELCYLLCLLSVCLSWVMAAAFALERRDDLLVHCFPCRGVSFSGLVYIFHSSSACWSLKLPFIRSACPYLFGRSSSVDS